MPACFLMFAATLCVDPSGVHELPASLPVRLSYDATDSRGRRRQPAPDSRAEDLILDVSRRSRLEASTRDLYRNASLCAWMVRRHLDYVAMFDFHSRTGVDAVDDQVERLMSRWFRKYNCDRAARHPFWRMVRILELMRTVHGDVGLLKLRDGRLQIIEGDRIRNPSGLTVSGDWVHGVKVDAAGRPLAYAIHRRRPYGGYELERIVPASAMILYGYYDRADQVRGISPIASAVNQLRDVYEAEELALAKMKVSQLFAMAFKRSSQFDLGAVRPVADEPASGQRYEVDFGRGPLKIELEPGDDVSFLEAGQPSAQFREFMQVAIAVALKSLDIPYSFADEAHTNFFASRAAWLHYERSCMAKRADLADLLNQIIVWRLQLFVLDGELTLPPGRDFGFLDWEIVPLGMPWWDPIKEINGDLAAIRAGLDNPQRITKDRGKGDWYDNIDEIAKALAYARSKGVPLAFDPAIVTTEPQPDGSDDGPPEGPEDQQGALSRRARMKSTSVHDTA